MRNLIFIMAFLVSIAIVSAAGGGGGGSVQRDVRITIDAESREATQSVRDGNSYDIRLTTGRVYPVRAEVADTVTLTFKKGARVTATETLAVNQHALIDLDIDNVQDINVSITAINGNLASLSVRELTAEQRIPPPPVQPAPLPSSSSLCRDLSTLRERVACRLNKSESELADEFLPEECRVESGAAQAVCIQRYHDADACYAPPVGVARLNCFRSTAGLPASVASARAACATLQCITALERSVFISAKLHFYDLEERAEELLERGVSRDAVVDFISAIEEKKIAFNTATTIADKKKLVLDVRALWTHFVAQAREDLR